MKIAATIISEQLMSRSCSSNSRSHSKPQHGHTLTRTGTRGIQTRHNLGSLSSQPPALFLDALCRCHVKRRLFC